MPTGTIARRAARAARVPYALTAHGTDVANAERSPRIRRATLRAVGGACAVFAVSAELGARLDAVAGPLGERLHIVSAGVDLDAFADGDAEVAVAALGWESDGPRVLHVGNLVPAKNLARLLEAFAAARSAWGGGSLALVGDGPQRDELEALARELGIGESVRFAGAVPPAEVPRWLRACDVACLVSQREGFGLAAIEALACGRPVVVARGVPASAAVEEGVTGALCDAGDVADIAAALQRAAALAPGARARAAAEPYSAGARGGTRRQRARLAASGLGVAPALVVVGVQLEPAAVGDAALEQAADEVVGEARRFRGCERLLVGLTRLAGLLGAALLEPVVARHDQRAHASASSVGGGLLGHIR